MTPESKALPENVAGALAYVTFLPAIAFLLLPPYSTNPHIRFHAWQSVFLAVAVFIASFLLTLMTIFGVLFGAYSVIKLNSLILIVWLAAWLLCVERALTGKRFMLPILGRLAEKQARL